MYWKVPKIWKNGDVWIIGGGPSITKEFDIPTNIVEKVVNGAAPISIYSPYFQPIHKKHVIGVNVAFLIGDWIDMLFFGDVAFYLKYKNEIRDFPGLKVAGHQSGANNENWIKSLRRDGNRRHGISADNGAVSWNGNSGCAAISVAAHTGAKRIFLLGFDMTLDENYRQHWHNKYGRPKLEAATSTTKNSLFAKHSVGFPKIAEDAKKLGIEIYNVSPNSKVKQFPKLTLQEALSL